MTFIGAISELVVSIKKLAEYWAVDLNSMHMRNEVTEVSKLDNSFLSQCLKDLLKNTGVIQHNKSDVCPI